MSALTPIRNFPKRLQVQVGIIVSFLLVGALGLYAWRTTQAQSENLTRAFRDQTTAIAKNIADTSVNNVLVKDLVAIETVLRKSAEFPDVLSISVTDKRGIVYSRVEREAGGPPHVMYAPEAMSPPADGKPATEIRKDRIVVWQPMVEGYDFGWVEIEYSLQVIRELRQRVWRESLIEAVLVVVASSFLILWYLNRHIGAVKRMTEFARRLREQRGEIIKVETSSLEIAQLMLALNETSLTLSEQTRSIRASEKKYRALFEESKDVIIIDTPEDRIVDINPAGVALFGYASRDELLAAHVGNDLYADPRDRESFKEIVARRHFVQDHEVKFKKKNGEPLTILITATPVYDEEGAVTAYRGILRDVTAERLLKDQLLQAQKMEAVGQLTGGIAHDFNNILSAVTSYVYLLKKKMAFNDPLMVYVNQVRTTVERAANLTRSLLAFSRKQVSTPGPVDMNEIVRKVDLLLAQVVGENIRLVTELSPEDLIVVADSGQMEQVLLNLATNARDAMPSGGSLTIATRLVEVDDDFTRRHGYGKTGRHVLLSVGDDGTGMDEATAKKIFEPFFTTKEVGKGTGLGLSIVYGIVKQHNGYISVSSRPGKGTTFEIYLAAATAGAAAAAAPDQESPRGGREAILVAEDDGDVRAATLTVLSEAGYRVVEAVDGEDATEKFREQRERIDLVLLDVMMPKKNGRQAFEEIRRIRPETKALFMSGYQANIIGDGSEGVEILSKPVKPNDLLKKVRELLDAA